MINITIEAANGADARQQMLDLLGINPGVTIGNGVNTFAGLPIAQPVMGIDPAVVGGAKSVKTLVDGEGNVLSHEVVDPKPEQTSRKRRTKAEIEAEAAALAANTGSEEPPASTLNTSGTEEENKAEDFNALMDKIQNDNDFEAFIKANPGEIEKQVEAYFSAPVKFTSTVSRDFMRGAAIVLGRKGKRDAVKEVMGDRSFSAQPGKVQVADEELNEVLNKFVKIYQGV